MATIVEDGSIVPNANSYISDEDFVAYAGERGITLTGIPSQLLLNAILYLEGLQFIGSKKTQGQSLQWPRTGVYIDGFNFPSTSIPKILIDLNAEVALAIDAGNDPLATVPRAVKKEKATVVDVTYADNAAPFAYSLKIKSLERKLIMSAGGSSFQVSRG